ncbi:MAG: molybdopterin-dependent oxidoreductase [Coriobacteriales bacterium]|jgi:anaerobic selenocysteine-containing dehydrogenase|nr:molybdopterin-dependent oxidoreductase [Coriobacteriales bacterium]
MRTSSSKTVAANRNARFEEDPMNSTDPQAPRTCATPLSRRSFVAGAAVAGAALSVGASAGGFDFFHPAEAFASEDSPVEIKYTYCDMCNHVPKCGIAAHVREGKIVRIESRAKYPATPLCAKGISSLQELYDPHRVLHPMKRTNAKGTGSPEWEDISWDEAYATIAQKLNSIKAQHGPDAVLFYCGDPKEPRGAMQRLATVFGSTSYGTESSVCAAASWMCAQMVFGQNSMGQDPGEATKSALIWSLNPAWSQPNRFNGLMSAKERGVKFVVVDPRITPTVSGLADIHLQLRPGSDGALVAGFINQLIVQGLYDKEFVKDWTVGFEELKAYVAEYTPEKVEEITWVPADKLIEAATLIGTTAPSTLVTSSKGACHTTNVGNFQRAVFMIPALLGSLDVTGGLALGPGLPFDYAASTPGFQLETLYNEQGYQSRRLDKDDFPVWAKYYKMMQTVLLPEYVAEGKIRAGVLLGANAMMWPDTPKYQEAIKNLEFSVAIDYYMRPWTHDFVDMLLPAAMCYERMAPFAIFGRKIFLREPVIEPLGEAREDWQIIFEIGTALGFGEQCFNGSVEAALEEMLKTTGLEVTMADLRANPEGFEVPGPAPEEKKYASGKLRKDGAPGFGTASGKVEFSSTVLKDLGFEGLPVYEEPVHSPVTASGDDVNYPLVLNTGSRVPYYTHSKLRDLPWLNQFMPNPVVRMSPQDAAARGLTEGEPVRVFNQQGSIEMELEVTNMVLPGVVDIFHGWHQADVNLLTTRDFDPITGFPPFSSGLCQVEKR